MGFGHQQLAVYRSFIDKVVMEYRAHDQIVAMLTTQGRLGCTVHGQALAYAGHRIDSDTDPDPDPEQSSARCAEPALRRCSSGPWALALALLGPRSSGLFAVALLGPAPSTLLFWSLALLLGPCSRSSGPWALALLGPASPGILQPPCNPVHRRHQGCEQCFVLAVAGTPAAEQVDLEHAQGIYIRIAQADDALQTRIERE